MIRRMLRALLGLGSSPADDPVVLPSTSAPASTRSSAVTASDSTQTNNNLVVVGENGEPYTLLQRSIDNGIETLLLGRSDGSQITLPLTDLSWKGAGTWLLTDAVRDARGLVIPVVEERLEVSRERVETGRVRISKSVEAREVVVDDPLKRESVRVEHVPINQVVTGAVPQVREEGDVTVIPILEERVVTRTELVLVEEVRIHRDHSEYHDPQRVTLRKEVVVVERFGEDGRPLPS
ncbi:MAG: hypothetical protein RLZZ206_2078 [Cyanobacteriota bacterium]|jgi:uncharacterized protein (TIGR02271 family)